MNKNIAFEDFINDIFYGNCSGSMDHNNIYFKHFVNSTQNRSTCDAYYHWGISPSLPRYVKFAKKQRKPLFLIEDGFLRSLYTYQADVSFELRSGISFTVDTKSAYFDAYVETDLEYLLNTYDITEEERIKAAHVIGLIKTHKLSKYNNQPVDIPIYGNTKKPKVLIIAQSYGDMSLKCGMVTDDVFKNMIKDAIDDNPNHEILFKIHPDTIATKTESVFLNESSSKLTVIYDYVNPISLLEQVDKVYVASSQMGFEALMCQKEVHVYGLPFYACWGLTHDKMKCERRKRVRTLEEIFYITYIKYSYYINPKSGKQCDIEDAIEYLLNLRSKFLE
ncbi:capsule biosynthesis protein [Photorhabdus luminescens]|nr:capsule biosynthesis protein [Photorhabdus luminescens]